MYQRLMAELSIKKEQSNYFMRNLKRRAASGSQDYERAAKQSKNTKSSQSGYSRRKESRERQAWILIIEILTQG